MTVSNNQLQDLHESTEYERWLLTRLSELSGDVDLEKYTVETLIEKDRDREISLDGNRHAYLKSTMTMGGGNVEQVISDITPLIFVSSYKCLDLFIEWFLDANEINHSGSRWTFEEKTEKIDNLDFAEAEAIPTIFQSNTQILECLSDMYIELVDYRHSVIHDRDFQVNDSVFLVEDDSGNSYTFEADELFSLAGSIGISIKAIVSDTHDHVTKRQLTAMLDNLVHIHNHPRFDLTRHDSTKVRAPMEAIQTSPYTWEPPVDQILDLAPVDRDNPDFWLNLVGLHNESTVCEWIIPGDELADELEAGFTISSGDFEQYTV